MAARDKKSGRALSPSAFFIARLAALIRYSCYTWQYLAFE